MTKRRDTEYLGSLVMELLADKKERTASQMCTEVHASAGQMRRTLAKLMDQGEIHICGFSSATQARIYRIGAGCTETPKRRVESSGRPRDTWIAADSMLHAAMFAMIRVGMSGIEP
ncbi:hypothetical protein [Burkholderia diffusa]|uniref:hypothetical protein n=1 Tax=Burkholderia diffusa TaxID=488732 RepID=UPI0012D9AB2C|nr:hypothetical protein [Burkholderia diffusa]